jgi:Fe-S cluster assembly protein SufD
MPPTPTTTTSKVLPFLDQLDAGAGAIPGEIQSPIAARRSAAANRYRQAEWPTRKVEQWKYTDLSRWALALADLAVSTQPIDRDAVVARVDEVAQDGPRLVLVDGRFDRELSRLDQLPEGVVLTGLAAAIEHGESGVQAVLDTAIPAEGRIFAALNEALMADGYFLSIAPGTVVEPIIALCFVNTGAAANGSHVRGLISVGEGAAAAVTEYHLGVTDERYFSNILTDVTVADGARFRHYKLQEEGAGALHIANILSRLGKDSTYDGFVMSTGADTARNDLYSVLEASGGETRLSGAYLGREKQHLDTSILVDHAAPDCTSRQVYKGVLDDRSRGVFQGKIIVRRAAQRTDGFQMNRGLLLSPHAEVNAKPELEIYADDVKCSHGSTVGEIDNEALFYFQSRGIDAAEARALLIEAYVEEAIEEIEIQSVRDQFSDRARRWMLRR